MAYVLKDGKRYYQDERGHLTLDNVSEQEAQQRTNMQPSILSYPSYPAGSWDSSGWQPQSMWRGSAAFWMILALIVSIAFGAAWYFNNTHESQVEREITEYMNQSQAKTGG